MTPGVGSQNGGGVGRSRPAGVLKSESGFDEVLLRWGGLWAQVSGDPEQEALAGAQGQVELVDDERVVAGAEQEHHENGRLHIAADEGIGEGFVDQALGTDVVALGAELGVKLHALAAEILGWGSEKDGLAAMSHLSQ
jgi:hypothetical protein